MMVAKHVSWLSLAAAVVVLVGIPVLGQIPPPPVKAVGSRDASSYRYESLEGGFRINFPAKPKVEVLERDSSFGKNRITVCLLSTALAVYTLTYTDFPTVMTDKYDLNVRFDMMRDATAKRENARVMEDSEFYFGTYFGRSNIYESGASSVSTRVFVVGPRLFALSVTTRGRLSTQSEKLRLANRIRIDKFFNSMAITNVPDPKHLAVELPRDFQVRIDGQKFSSEFFDVVLTAPDKWAALGRDDADLLLELGKDDLKRTNPTLADHLTDKTARVLAVFTKSSLDESVPGGVLVIMAEKVPYPNFLASAVARTYAQLYLDPTEKVVVEPTTTHINGVELAWIETLDSATKIRQRIYFANRRGISFEIAMSYQDKSDLAAMLESLKSMRFGPNEDKR